MIVVRLAALRLRNELLARHARERIEHARVAHVACADLFGHHPCARDGGIRDHLRPMVARGPTKLSLKSHGLGTDTSGGVMPQRDFTYHLLSIGVNREANGATVRSAERDAFGISWTFAQLGYWRAEHNRCLTGTQAAPAAVERHLTHCSGL